MARERGGQNYPSFCDLVNDSQENLSTGPQAAASFGSRSTPRSGFALPPATSGHATSGPGRPTPTHRPSPTPSYGQQHPRATERSDHRHRPSCIIQATSLTGSTGAVPPTGAACSAESSVLPSNEANHSGTDPSSASSTSNLFDAGPDSGYATSGPFNSPSFSSPGLDVNTQRSLLAPALAAGDNFYMSPTVFGEGGFGNPWGSTAAGAAPAADLGGPASLPTQPSPCFWTTFEDVHHDGVLGHLGREADVSSAGGYQSLMFLEDDDDDEEEEKGDHGNGAQRAVNKTIEPGSVPSTISPWADATAFTTEEPIRKKSKPASRRSTTKKAAGEAPIISPTASSQTSPLTATTSPATSVTSPMATAKTTTLGSAKGRPSKLRSASRTSKNAQHRPAETAEERRSRASHNMVEKQYRNRLNTEFEHLLNVLPEELRGVMGVLDPQPGAEDDTRRVSKAEVLEMAREYIRKLERGRLELETENRDMLEKLDRLKKVLMTDNDGYGCATDEGVEDMDTVRD